MHGWLNGEKLRSSKVRKQYKLIGLILVLIFVYITAGYRAMEQQHRLSDLRKEVRDKKFEYLTISSQLVNETRQSRVAKPETKIDIKQNAITKTNCRIILKSSKLSITN